jgi:hypothetical protein
MRRRFNGLLAALAGMAMFAGIMLGARAQETSSDAATAAGQADSMAKQKAAAAQAEYATRFGGIPEISEEEEMGTREFEEPGDIPDFVREQIGEAKLVQIYCAMTRWKTGDLFSAIAAADREVKTVLDAAADLDVTVAMPDTASIKAEAEKRIQAVCAAKDVDEANRLVLDFQSWGKTGMDDKMKATRSELQSKMSAKGVALCEEITDFVEPLAEEESAKMSAYMQSQAANIAAQYQSTFEGRTSAPSDSEIAAVKAEIQGKLDAIAAAEEPKIRARIEAQIEAKFGETKKGLEDFGKTANGIGTRIKQYIEAHRGDYDQYRDEALKLRRDAIVEVLKSRLAEALTNLEDARADIDEDRKNDPTLPKVDEIKSELQEDADGLAAKLDAALEAGDEQALQGHLEAFESKWDNYRATLEARALGSVSGICGKALSQLAPVKQKISDNTGRIDSLLDSCSGDTSVRCLKVGEFAPRLDDLATRLDDLTAGIDTIEAVCAAPESTSAKELAGMLKQIESDGNAVKVFGEALEAEKNQVIAESAKEACDQALPRTRAGLAEIDKGEMDRLESEIAKCKKTGFGLCEDSKVTDHMSRIEPLMDTVVEWAAEVEEICKNPDEEKLAELEDARAYLEDTGDKLRRETKALKVITDAYERPTMSYVCQSAMSSLNVARKEISLGLAEMNKLTAGCTDKTDARCAAIAGSSGKIASLRQKANETFGKIDGIAKQCKNAGKEEATDEFLTSLNAIRDDEAALKKLADEIKGTVDLTWPNHIKSGKAFKVVLDIAPKLFDDSKWTGDWRTDQMGTIRGGDTYTMKYGSSGWTATGYNEGRAATGSWTYRSGDPEKFELDIWGRVFSFDDKGNVYDPDYGLVGHLTK